MTRPGARRDAARSAPGVARSPAPMTSSGGHAIVASVDEEALERARERLCRGCGGQGERGGRRGGARTGAGSGRGARRDRRRARVFAPRAGRRRRPGRHPRRGAAGLAPARRGARARQPDDPAARADRDGAARRAQLPGRRPRPARRPDRLRAGGRWTSGSDGSRRRSRRHAARPSTASAKPPSVSHVNARMTAHVAAHVAIVRSSGASVSRTFSGSSPRSWRCRSRR